MASKSDFLGSLQRIRDSTIQTRIKMAYLQSQPINVAEYRAEVTRRYDSADAQNRESLWMETFQYLRHIEEQINKDKILSSTVRGSVISQELQQFLFMEASFNEANNSRLHNSSMITIGMGNSVSPTASEPTTIPQPPRSSQAQFQSRSLEHGLMRTPTIFTTASLQPPLTDTPSEFCNPVLSNYSEDSFSNSHHTSAPTQAHVAHVARGCICNLLKNDFTIEVYVC